MKFIAGLVATLAAIVGALLFLGFFALLGGTVVFVLWPTFAPALGLPILGWWECVVLSWTCSILFKGMSN